MNSPNPTLSGQAASVPRLSVCVCTHNGARRLKPVIDCLAAQTAPPADWEVIVVDNASTDDTAAVATALVAQFGVRGRLVPEPRPGQMRARHRASLEARGEIVCFLDDDNLAAPDFLELALRHFDRHPRTGSLGGRIASEWEAEPTPLVRAVEGYALAIVDRGDAPFAYEWVADGPVGAGLCIRRELLREALEDPALCAAISGRSGASLASGDDMALAVKVRQAGYERRYEPALRLRHRLSAERMTRPYLLRLYDGIGRGQAAVRRLWARGGTRRSVALVIGLKDLLLWLRGLLGGPGSHNNVTFARLAQGAVEPALRRDLHALDQSLLWGRFAAAMEYAFSGFGRKA